MATRFAVAVRHTCLQLPWNFKWRVGLQSQAYSQSPAAGCAFLLLNPTGHWPQEAYDFVSACSYEAYKTADDSGLCYFCKSKTATLGLHFSCSKCNTIKKHYEYVRTYSYALQFASQSWKT